MSYLCWNNTNTTTKTKTNTNSNTNTNTIAKRCEEYVISLLEQCEDLREVETFLQTR